MIFKTKRRNIPIYLTRITFFQTFVQGDGEDGSDADSSVRMKIKLKGRKNEGRGGRRKRVTKKYISDDDDDADDN